MPLYVPKLARKLQSLYQRHTHVNTHERLAEHLSIAANNISTWINGNSVRAPEMVPVHHVKRISDLYNIDTRWLELDSLDEFKAMLFASPSSNGPWQDLASRAAENDTLQLLRSESQAQQQSSVRGLVADDPIGMMEQFRLGDRLYVAVNLTGEWAEYASLGKAHLMLFCVDNSGTSCLCPSSLAPDPRLKTAEFYLPNGAPAKSLRVTGPAGQQSVFALFTSDPFPRDVYAELMGGNTGAVLDRIAVLVLQSTTAWQLLRKTYIVE